MTAGAAAWIAWALWTPPKTEENPRPDLPEYHVIPAVEIAPPSEPDEKK
jgi:hypothetical protein